MPSPASQWVKRQERQRARATIRLLLVKSDEVMRGTSRWMTNSPYSYAAPHRALGIRHSLKECWPKGPLTCLIPPPAQAAWILALVSQIFMVSKLPRLFLPPTLIPPPTEVSQLALLGMLTHSQAPSQPDPGIKAHLTHIPFHGAS